MDKHRKLQEVDGQCSNPSDPEFVKNTGTDWSNKPLANNNPPSPIYPQNHHQADSVALPCTALAVSRQNLNKMAIPLQRLRGMFNTGPAQVDDGPIDAPNAPNVPDPDAGGGVEAVQPLPGWRLALLGLSLSLGLFLAMLDTSIVATCLYSIAADFKTMESINCVALAYTLSYLGCAVLFARISDVIGRKAAVMLAFSIFIAFSMACGFSQSLTQLIIFRAFQGIGGSGLYSLAIIIFPEVTPKEQRKYIGMVIGLVIASSGVMGPVLGGLLTQYRTWHWVFWINGPIGVASMALFWFSWPTQEYLPRLERRLWRDLDYLGSFLVIAASVLIVFAFQAAGEDTRWGKALFIAPLVVGVLSILALFVWEFYIERRWKGQMAAAIPLRLLRNQVYTIGVLNTMILGFPYLLCVYSFPLRFQVVYRKTPLQAGLMLLPMLGASALASMLSGPLNSKKNRLCETLIAASGFMLLGCVLEFVTLSPSESVEPKVLGFLVFVGFGFGLSASASTMLGAIESPIREHATAQGIIAQLRILGGSLGIAASTAILAEKTRAQLSDLSPEQLSNLAAPEANLTPMQESAVRFAYTASLREEMSVCLGILVLAFLITFSMYQPNRISIDDAMRARELEEEARLQALQEPLVLPPHPAGF